MKNPLNLISKLKTNTIKTFTSIKKNRAGKFKNELISNKRILNYIYFARIFNFLMNLFTLLKLEGTYSINFILNICYSLIIILTNVFIQKIFKFGNNYFQKYIIIITLLESLFTFINYLPFDLNKSELEIKIYDFFLLIFFFIEIIALLNIFKFRKKLFILILLISVLALQSFLLVNINIFIIILIIYGCIMSVLYFYIINLNSNNVPFEENLILEEILKLIPVGILIIDKFSKICFFNYELSNMLGLKESNFNTYSEFLKTTENMEFIDQNNHVILLKDDQKISKIVENFLKSNNRASYFIQNTDNQSIKGVKLTLNKLENSKILLIFENMDRLNKLKLLKEDYLSRNRMICSLSHELRTPLNGCIPQVEELKKNRKIPLKIQIKLIDSAYSSLKLLQNSLNDFIDFAMLTSDQFLMNIQEFSLQELLIEIEQIILPIIQAKSLLFQLKIENFLPKTIISDSSRIQQIILNLISNSIKFTYDGFITLSIRYFTDKFQYFIEFVIEDSGIGINPEKLIRLKTLLNEPTLYNSESLGSTGSSLGLLISQNLAIFLCKDDALSGIHCESNEGKGSKFSFCIQDFSKKKIEDNLMNKSYNAKKTLINESESFKELILGVDKPMNVSIEEKNKNSDRPIYLSYLTSKLEDIISIPETSIKITSNRKEENLSSSDENPANKLDFITCKFFEKNICQCPSILCVDDDIFNLESLSIMLKQDYLPYFAMNGFQALEKVKNFKKCNRNCQGLRLILMDYAMPLMDGVETTKELCFLMLEKKIKEVPIVGLTAFGTKEEVEKCLNAGMKELIFKPVNRYTLKKTVEKWIVKN